jgi:hypothetical protein
MIFSVRFNIRNRNYLMLFNGMVVSPAIMRELDNPAFSHIDYFY